MITRVKVPFAQEEYSALLKDSGADLRDPPDQVRYVVRQHLAQRGLLPADTSAPIALQPAQEKEAAHVG